MMMSDNISVVRVTEKTYSTPPPEEVKHDTFGIEKGTGLSKAVKKA